jgi:5'-3' exonuclease
MIETALVDGDIVAYRCATACEKETEDIATWQTSEMMRRILHETNALSYKCFLSGDSNFRYQYNPDYKANRRDMQRPRWLQHVRSHLVTVWNASVTDGIEADDAMGIEQCLGDGNTVICTIDKDLLMIPGHHYNFVKQEGRHVSPLEGLRHFYFQLIMGDRTDNIFGYDGKARQKVPQFLEADISFLEECMEEWDMFCHVRDMYNEDERLLMNGRCLWILREENQVWNFPVEKSMDGGTA